MKLMRLFSPLLALPVLFALSGCDSKTAQKAEEEYNAPLAKGIEEMAENVQTQPPASGNISIAPEMVVSFTLSVPSPAWSLSIDEVWVVGQQIWAISSLHEKEGMSTQVITTARASATLKNVPKLPVVYYVLGKTFDWEKAGPNVQFIDSRSEIEEGLEAGEQIYPAQK